MVGGTTSTADMIKQTKRGLLFTRFWYIREVDPQTVLLTGLTRDGVFLIEHGAITRPVHNFRFNESPVAMLNKVRAMGPSVRDLRRGGSGHSGLHAAVAGRRFHAVERLGCGLMDRWGAYPSPQLC